MSRNLLIQDVVLYVIIVLGILLYSGVLRQREDVAEGSSQYPRRLRNRVFVFMLIAVSILFVVGILHQLNVLTGYIAIVIMVVAAIGCFSLLIWLRTVFRPNK